MYGITPQNRHVTSLTQQFLNVHWDRKSSLLLGYSGGPDSKALLYALLENDVKPSLAHVDHGWREESADEAEVLRKEAAKLGCPFYTIRLNLPKKEDVARNARFTFFASQIPSHQALLLAHQADDLAETVLKRILEGAHLPHLSGMQEVSEQYGMPIWRPFLKVRRSEILEFLNDRSLEPMLDPSNVDPAYLRSRMRLEIFPFLNETFGKQTTENLVLLSERALELKSYLDRKVASVKVQRGPWGTFVDLEGLERLERRHLLQNLARQESYVLGRELLETLLNWVEQNLEKKHLIVKTKKIIVDKGRVFFFSLSAKDSFSTF